MRKFVHLTWNVDSIGMGETVRFEGRTQTLDHILVTDGLYARLVKAHALHINADYLIGDREDASARRVSDQDPLGAVFSLE